jgi:hypothetical protein
MAHPDNFSPTLFDRAWGICRFADEDDAPAEHEQDRDWSDLIERAQVAAEDRELYPEDYAIRDQRLADAFAREAASINHKHAAE